MGFFRIFFFVFPDPPAPLTMEYLRYEETYSR